MEEKKCNDCIVFNLRTHGTYILQSYFKTIAMAQSKSNSSIKYKR